MVIRKGKSDDFENQICELKLSNQLDNRSRKYLYSMEIYKEEKQVIGKQMILQKYMNVYILQIFAYLLRKKRVINDYLSYLFKHDI